MAEVLPIQMPQGVMSPGTYLRKRRQAAGYEPRALACLLVAAMPWPIGAPTEEQVDNLTAYLQQLELDQFTLTRRQAEIIREFLPVDLPVYAELVDLRNDGPDSGLPQPNICTTCGCTHFRACIGADGRPCAWTDLKANLCTACDEAKPRFRIGQNVRVRFNRWTPGGWKPCEETAVIIRPCVTDDPDYSGQVELKVGNDLSYSYYPPDEVIPFGTGA